jgi:DNA-binding NtrC family response regulator
MHPFHFVVVDHDPHSRSMIVDCLITEGARVTPVSTRDEALSLLNQGEVDALFVAIDSGAPSDFAWLRLMRQRWPNVAVVVIAQQAFIEALLETLRLGATDFLSKPLTAKAISQAVGRVCHQFRQLRGRCHSAPTLGTSAHRGALPKNTVASHQAEPDQRENAAAGAITIVLEGDLKTMQRRIIAEAIKQCQGNKAAAARLLGLHRRTLYRMLQARARCSERIAVAPIHD